MATVAAAAGLDPTQYNHLLLWQNLAAGEIQTARRRLSDPLPGTTTWANDAGVAHGEWALCQGQPEDFEAALNSLTSALDDTDSALTARFNRAVLFQRLGLSDHAEAEWVAYLAAETDAAWLAVAQRHRARLAHQPPDEAQLWETFTTLAPDPKTPAMQAFLAQHLGKLVSHTAIAQSERLATSGDAKQMAQLQQLAEVAKDQANDHWMNDLIQALGNLRTTGQGAAWLAARQELHQARQHYPIEGKPTVAEPLYAHARQTFLDLGDVASAAEADLGLVYCAVQRPETTSLDRLSAALLTLARERRYARLEGQALRVRAQLALRQANAALATTHCQAALARFRALADWEEVQRTLLILSDAYERQGDSRSALTTLRELLVTGLEQGTNPRRHSQACAFAARTCAAAGAFELGVIFADEARTAATGQAFPAFQLDAEILLAVLGIKVGRPAEAAAALERAETMLAGIEDPRTRDVLALDFLPTAAWCRLELGDPVAALRLCATAADNLRQGQHDAYWPLVQSVRSAAHLALGDDRAAEADLQAGIRWLEATRLRLTKTPDRQRFFHRHADLYERLAHIWLKRGASDKAFAWLERARARTLLDRRQALSNPAPTPIDASQAFSVQAQQKRLPSDIVIAAYAVGADQTEGFVLDRHGLRHRTLPVGREQLNRDILALTRALTHPSDDPQPLRQTGQRLYATLIAPLDLPLETTRRLVIVPDGPLHALPWAALCDTQARWLPEQTPFSICPSVAALIQALEPRSLPHNQSVLMATDAHLTFPVAADALPPLPGARDEMLCLQALLNAEQAKSVQVLAGEQVTKANLLDALQTAGLAHLAVHGVAMPNEPLQSALYLTAAPTDDGRLTAAEIYERSLPCLQLVVLSACESALGAALQGEGPTGLGQAFLAAGAASVIATLARVDDRAMRDLMCAFHAAWQAGASPSVALQVAQRACLGQHPAQWAVVVALGAP
ncbi:MAG: CHAT domain-containing protein [Chloracidobacterium sp.]